jgi:putative membrane protein
VHHKYGSTRGRAKPYEGFQETDLIVRDHLALDRTQLANERTLLAYLRSGVALLLAGATLFHFAQSSWLAWVGIGCLPLGGLTLMFGLWRFFRTARRLRRFR